MDEKKLKPSQVELDEGHKTKTDSIRFPACYELNSQNGTQFWAW